MSDKIFLIFIHLHINMNSNTSIDQHNKFTIKLIDWKKIFILINIKFNKNKFNRIKQIVNYIIISNLFSFHLSY